MNQVLLIRLHRACGEQSVWKVPEPSPTFQMGMQDNFPSCKPTFDPRPAPCLTGQLSAYPTPSYRRGGNLGPEPAVIGAESVAGASGTLARYEPKEGHEPHFQLGLESRETGSRRRGQEVACWGRGHKGLMCGCQHLWLGTQVRTTFPPHPPRDGL